MPGAPQELRACGSTEPAVKHIVSRDNPRFKTLRRWATQGRARREAKIVLLEGGHLIEAYVSAGGKLDEVVVSASGAIRPEIASWLAAHVSCAALQVPDRLFDELAAAETPSGILGVGRLDARETLPDLVADSVLLDGVQDPGNLGTLLRTAAAAGFRQVLLGPGSADPWSAKALRAGQGAQFLVSLQELADAAAFVRSYRGHSVVTRLDASRSLYDVDFRQPVLWIFGAEGQGVSAEVSSAATCAVRIPMPGGTESLNVAAAAAICLFETVRQRN